MGDSSLLDFGFVFDDKDFSDQVLHIEIIPDQDSLNATDHSNNGSDCSNGVIVKTLHISSLLLAVKSPFFHKLFKSDMKEAQQGDVTLRMNSTEELSALMDVLNFIYKNALCATTSSDLLGVLMAANKFEVTCCMKYCTKALLEMPMSQESALLYLELPSSVSTSDVVQPLIDASKEYLFTRYKDFNKSTQEEAMKLPLSAIEVVLGSDGLRVVSEDVVFDFILDWARTHYSKLEARREILTKHLTRFICFPNMSSFKLKEVLVRPPGLDHEQMSKLVLDALFSKVDGYASKGLLPRRVYTCQVIKVVQLESPWPGCFAYFTIRKDKCADLFPSKSLHSKIFLLGECLLLQLMAKCEEHRFVLYVKMVNRRGTCTLECVYAVNNRLSSMTTSCTIARTRGSFVSTWDMHLLFGIPWAELMSDDDNGYFIEDILHLRFWFTLKEES